jgi:hypothetical protein
MDLAVECGESYKRSKAIERREWNQAWFQWIEIDMDENGQSETRTAVRTPLMEVVKTARVQSGDSGSRESRRNLNRRPTAFSYSHGLRVRTLVGRTGLEPLTPSA